MALITAVLTPGREHPREFLPRENLDIARHPHEMIFDAGRPAGGRGERVDLAQASILTSSGDALPMSVKPACRSATSSSASNIRSTRLTPSCPKAPTPHT